MTFFSYSRQLLRFCACSNSLLFILRVTQKRMAETFSENGSILSRQQIYLFSQEFKAFDIPQTERIYNEVIKAIYDIIQKDDKGGYQINKNWWPDHFYLGLSSLALSKTLLLSFLIYLTVCRCDFELSLQMFRFRRVSNDKVTKIEQLYDNLYRINFCQILNSFKDVISNRQEQKVFLINLLAVSVLQTTLSFRIQKHFDVERTFSSHDIVLNSFIMLLNGNDLLLPAINSLSIISLDFVKYLLIRQGSLDEQQEQELLNLFQPNPAELVCQLLLIFAVINFISIQLKEQLVAKQIKLNQLMMNSINKSLDKKERVIVAQLGLVLNDTEQTHGMSLIAAKNIIYCQISDLKGQPQSLTLLGNFLNQVSARILTYDQKFFYNNKYFDCFGGRHDINSERNEIPLMDFLQTFDKYDIDKHQVISFIHRNLMTSLAMNFPYFFVFDQSESTNQEMVEIQLQNGNELNFSFELQMNLFKAEMTEQQISTEIETPLYMNLEGLTEEEQKTNRDATTGSANMKGLIKVEGNRSEAQDNEFLKQQQNSFRAYEMLKQGESYAKPRKPSLEFTVEDPQKIQDQEESSEFVEESFQEQIIQNQGEDHKIKRTSTKDIVRIFEEETKERSNNQQQSDDNVTFSDWTKISSFEMKRKIFQLGPGSASNNELISSIQNSYSERIRNRRDSSNPSTSLEQQVEQRINEEQDTNFEMGSGQDKNDESNHEQNPNFDNSLNNQQNAEQTINQLNEEIENEGIMVEEIMHDRMMKIQGQLKNNRLFMDMVIHDMRNPTVAIQLNIQEIFERLKNEQNKAQWIKSQRKLTRLNLMSVNSQITNMMSLPNSSSLSISSALQHSNQTNQNKQQSSQSQQIDIYGSNSQSKSDNSEIEEEKDPSLILKRTLNNMVYSDPSYDHPLSKIGSNIRSAENQHPRVMMNIQNVENQSAMDNFGQLQQLSISNKMAFLNQVNSEKKPLVKGFSDLMSMKQKLFPSSNYLMQFSHSDSSSFNITDILKELYFINQDARMRLLDQLPYKQSLFYQKPNLPICLPGGGQQRQSSLLKKGLYQAILNEQKERNIVTFLSDMRAKEICILSKQSEESKREDQRQESYLGSEEDEQIPQNQNEGINSSISFSQRNMLRRSQQNDGHRFSQLGLVNSEFDIEPPQIIEAEFENEEDFEDKDLDEMPAQIEQQNVNENNPRVFNNPLKFMQTKNNQFEQIEKDQMESMVKSIGSKLSFQLNQIDSHLALQDDQQDSNPILKYWKDENEQQQNQILSNTPLSQLKQDFSELVRTLEEYKSIVDVRSRQIQSNQIKQVVFEKPLVQTANKGTQFQGPGISALIQQANFQQRPSSLQLIIDRNLEDQDLMEVSNARQGQNSQIHDSQNMSSFRIDSIPERKFQDQSVQCDVINQDMTYEICQLRAQNQIISQKMRMFAGYYSKLQDQNQDLKQQRMADQHKLYDLQNNIERYDKELSSIEAQESQKKTFLGDLIKFLQNTVYQSKMLNNLINDMLDLAKFESGTFKFHNDYFDLTEIVYQAFETLRHQAAKKGITLEFKLRDERIKIFENTQNASNLQDVLNPSGTNGQRSIDSNHAQDQSENSCPDFYQSGTSNASRAELRNDSENHTDQQIIMNTRSTIDKEIKNYFTNILGDQNRYLQIFLNIIGNSINYTKKGSVTVTFILVEEQDIKQRNGALSQDLANEKYHKINKTSSNWVQQNEESHFHSERGFEEIKQIAQRERVQQSSDRIRANQTVKQINVPAVFALGKSTGNQTQDMSLLAEILRDQESDSGSLRFQNENNSNENNPNSLVGNQSNTQQNRYPKTEHTQLSSAREAFSQQSQQNHKFITFRIEIKDTGVGLSQEDIPKLFTDFTRLDKNMNKKGTGLGLSICKQIIEKMGGSVDVQSVLGEGSTFRLSLSAKTNTQPKQFSVSDSNKENSDRNLDIQRSLINNIGSQQNFTSSNTNNHDSAGFHSSLHVKLSSSNEKFQRQLSMQMGDQREIDIIKRGLSSYTLSSGHPNYNEFSLESSLSNRMMVSGQRSITSGRQSIGNGSDQRGIHSTQGSQHSQITVMKIQEVQRQPTQRPQFTSIEDKLIIQPGLPLIREENEMSSILVTNNNEESKEQERSPQIQQQPIHFKQIMEQEESEEQIVEQQSSNTLSPNENQNSSSIFSFNPLLQPIFGPNQDNNIFNQAIQESNAPPNFTKAMQNFDQKSQLDILKSKPKQDLKYRCLIANDEDFLLMANRNVLETCKIEAIGVINGLEAFETVTTDPKWFDVIILDLTMPIMDGFTAATKINSHFNEKNRLFSDLDLIHQSSNKTNESIKNKIKQFKSSIAKRQQRDGNQFDVDDESMPYQDLSIEDVLMVKPLMVACSNHLSDYVRQECKNAGFDLCLMQPLTVAMVNNQIIPILSKEQK